MTSDSAATILSPPFVTADLPGIGGKIKVEPEDFEVEEVPAYEPSGQGDFLYLWIEKRDVGAEFFTREVARRLGLAVGDVGTAGLKDRRAVTRQWVSVPAAAEPQLALLDGEGLRLLQVSRHSNKLRPGHLRGNRFRILVRDPVADPASVLDPVVQRLKATGLPNYYGPQRFGRDQETLLLGLRLIYQSAGVTPPTPWSALLAGGPQKPVRNPFLKKLALSALQSALFNLYLGQRLTDGLLRTVLAGDVMAKLPVGGMFTAEDVPTEQQRFEARETVHAGPMFGKKTFPARQDAAARERALLESVNLSTMSFSGFGKLLQGTRRHNLVYLDDLTTAVNAEGVRLSFTLPAGSYATVFLREVMKVEINTSEMVQ